MRNVKTERILQRIGGFGRWQRMQFGFLAPSGVLLCWLNFLFVFIATDTSAGSCQPDSRANLSFIDQGDTNNTAGFTTIVQWNLTCDRNWLRNWQQISFGIGAVVGVPSFFILSDKCGRKRILLLTAALLALCGSLAPYSQLYTVFVLFRGISGFLASGMRICITLLTFETASALYHTWVVIVWDITHAVGYMLLSAVASVSDNWHTVYNVSTSITVVLLVYTWLVPESPRWLLLHKRTADAERVLRKIAMVNGHKLRHESVAKKLTISEQEVADYNNYSFAEIRKERRVLVCFLQLLTCWFSSYTAYFLFCYSIPTIGAGQHLHVLHSVAGMVELMSLAVGCFITKLQNRKTLTASALVICVALCVFTPAVPTSSYKVLAVLALFAKFFLHVHMTTMQLITVEFLPHEFHGVVFPAALTTCYFAVILASFGMNTNYVREWLPLLLAGVCSLVTLIFNLLLPELNLSGNEEADNRATNEESRVVQVALADASDDQSGNIEMQILNNNTIDT